MGNPFVGSQYGCIKFVSNNFYMICTHTAQYFASQSLCWGSFLIDFCQNFWQFLKKSPAVVWAGRPDIVQSLQIFFLISKECPTIILDARDILKSFKNNSTFFFNFHFWASTWRVPKITFFAHITFQGYVTDLKCCGITF